MSDQTAWDVALKKLSFRDYSTAEIESFLSQQGFPSQEVESTLERLTSYQFLSDTRLASAIVRGATHKGNRWIQQKLQKRKLLPSTIQEALETSSSETERAQEVAQKKWHKIRANTHPERVQKLVSFLAQRGFSAEVCWKVAKAMV